MKFKTIKILKFFHKLHLSTKLFLIIALLNSFISVFIYFYFPQEFTKQAYESNALRANSLADIIVLNMPYRVYFNDTNALKQLLLNTIKIPELNWIVITDANGRIISQIFKDKQPIDMSSIDQDTVYNSQHDNIVKIKDFRLRGSKIGSLKIGVSIESVNKSIRDFRITLAIVSILIFLIGSILAYFLSKFILKQIGIISSSIISVSKGDYSKRIPSVNDDELGKLTELFNQMVDNLEKTHLNLTNEIQERKSVEDKLLFSDLILQQVSAIVLVMNPKGEIVYASPYIKTVLGYETDEVMGFNWWTLTREKELLAHQSMDFFINISNSKFPINKSPYENMIRSKDGSIRWFQWQDVKSSNDDIISVGHDISSQKLANEDLKIAKEKLAEALLIEKKLNELKTRFVSVVSHEYRTPLTVILTSTYLVDKFFELNDKVNFDQQIEKIRISINNMTNLLEDVLLVGKSDAGAVKFNSEPFEIIELVRNCIQETLIIDKFNHVIALETEASEIVINSDIHLMKRILMNLLVNATKYSPKESEIKCEFRILFNNLEIKITDFGIGIPSEEIELIFQPFQRFSNVGAISGSGLGLSIVKRSVDIMNGTILVSSELGKGTTFTLNFPI